MAKSVKTLTRRETWVCVECYVAHHFGVDSVESPDHGWNKSVASESFRTGDYTDWSCPEHDYEESWCDNCDSDDDGTTVFSKAPCDTCGTSIAGSRHRLARWTK
jgi:hypothetical protein